MLVEGDEQKRKAKYIELRGEQLYAQSAPAKSQSIRTQQPVTSIQPVPVEQPVSGIDVRGTYSTEITGRTRNPYLKITLRQQGVNITGSWDNDPGNRIEGILLGGTIKFIWLESHSSFDRDGKWKIDADGNGMTGRWNRPDGRSSGKFNLTKMY